MPSETELFEQQDANPVDRGDQKESKRPCIPGQYAPAWYSPHQWADLDEELKKQMMRLCDLVGQKDVAARRWEVEQSWESRLFDRGYQFLLKRRGGGWIAPNLSTPQTSGINSGRQYYGYETNIYTTYGEIITGALTRDIPQVRFEPQNPMDDADLTAANSGTKFGKIFARNNDLLNFQHQLVYFLRNDGRSIIVTDYILDAQRFGWEQANPLPSAVPETETELSQALLYLVRHGETESNAEDVMRESDEPLDDQGQTESLKAADYLAKKGIHKIVSSSLPRAQQTAQQISQKTGIPVETDERLDSLDKGNLEGEPSDEAGEEIENQFKNAPDRPIPGGESPDNFESRIRSALFEHLQNTQTVGRTAIVMHDSGISESNKVFTGNESGPTDIVAPGGIAAVYAAQGGGFDLRPVLGQSNPEAGAQIGREPRGQEIVQCFGKLEGKVPINVQNQHDMPYVQVCYEVDIAQAKAMFPDYADQIRPGSPGSGENELDRIARINAALALEASYVTGDSMVRDCTIQRTWFRPSFFFEIEDQKLREMALDAFPDGALCVYAGETFVGARNECMDDHITVVQAFPGSGQNRISLLSKILPIQKRVNNWVDLLNAFFIKTVPMKWMDSETFDLSAIKNQGNEPGGIGGFQRQPGYTPDQLCWIEPTPTHQPTLPEFIKYFIMDLPQLLSGALPSLFGDESNTDTVGGITIQRDQALGRLSTPWHAIQMATCSYFRQGVSLAARCRKNAINESIPGEGIISVELGDLKGNILCFPSEDKNFPETWNQKQARLQQLTMDAANPLVQGLMMMARNQKLMINGIGMSEFGSPLVDAYEKQLGEFKVLLKSGPMPNPELIQAQQQFEQQSSVLSQKVSSGIILNPSEEQGLMQLQQQIRQIPPMVSTVPIDPKTDNHAGEAAACLDWINGPDGRRMKYGTESEREAFLNIHTHWAEHDAAAQSMKDPSVQPPKSPSKSINIKDLPPGPAAAIAAQAGIPASPQDFAMQDQQEAQQKLVQTQLKAKENLGNE